MEHKNLQRFIQHFVMAVDQQNAQDAAEYLDENFRVILNNQLAQGSTILLNKEQYLTMMRSGKVGGTPRTIEFLFTDIEETMAVIKVKLEGMTRRFITFYNLIKVGDDWKIISDIPVITDK